MFRNHRKCELTFVERIYLKGHRVGFGKATRNHVRHTSSISYCSAVAQRGREFREITREILEETVYVMQLSAILCKNVLETFSPHSQALRKTRGLEGVAPHFFAQQRKRKSELFACLANVLPVQFKIDTAQNSENFENRSAPRPC